MIKKNQTVRQVYRKVKAQQFHFNFFILKIKMAFYKKRDIQQIKNQELVFGNIKNLQADIDSLDYPPTHQYFLEPLEPKGTLKMRFEQFKILMPGFFSVDKFLDIGCNKGFFSLLACKNSNLVHSFDFSNEFVRLCDKLKQKNMIVEKTTFRDFYADKQYDSILLGNVHHYLFKECEGWEWIYKLAAISKGYVLIEGPVDMTCELMYDAIPEKLQKNFTFEKFMSMMSKFFTLEIKTKSVIKDRYVMLFKRRLDCFNLTIELGNLPIVKPFRQSKHSFSFLTRYGDNYFVAKIYKNPKKDLRNRIIIASMSPYSNGIIGSVVRDGNFIGWFEKYSDGKVYKQFENQKELLIMYCDHMIFLSKLGYIETDWSGINVFADTNKIFDKGGVSSIKNLQSAAFEKYPGHSKGFFFIHYGNSFDLLTAKQLDLIYDALKTRDSKFIEHTFSLIKAFIE